MPRRVASAMAARLASGSCQRLSSSVPSMSSAMSRTAIPELYRESGNGLVRVVVNRPTPWFLINVAAKALKRNGGDKGRRQVPDQIRPGGVGQRIAIGGEKKRQT